MAADIPVQPQVSSEPFSMSSTSNDDCLKGEQPTDTSNPPAAGFPTIPCFPLTLVSTLQRKFGATLLSRHTGVFDVNTVCIKIGKEVTRLNLGS